MKRLLCFIGMHKWLHWSPFKRVCTHCVLIQHRHLLGGWKKPIV